MVDPDRYTSEGSREMSTTGKDLVSSYYERVLNGRDLDAVSDFFHDERLVQGIRAGCFSYFEAFPDLHLSVEELIAEGDVVFCRSLMTGTHDGEYKGIAPTGRNVSSESAEVFRVADGKFVGYWCLANVAGLTRQLTEEAPVGAAS
jgi:predicted ester cyclase